MPLPRFIQNLYQNKVSLLHITAPDNTCILFAGARRVKTLFKTAGIAVLFDEKVEKQQSHAALDPSILETSPLSNVIDATLAFRHRLPRSQYVRAVSLGRRLALTALALAAVFLFVFSLGAPKAFEGQSLTYQISLASPQIGSTVVDPLEGIENKYFYEPGQTDLLGHYDIRYYKGHTVSDEERSDTLYHMIRAYLSTFRDLQIETWIAHGTLLGWWWNGQILPWDWDLDVQVTGETLAYLARKFNYTTHSYKSGSVKREYFLDVNPFYWERVRGDGWNIIDARWIDTRNGLFIDITGISETDPVGRPGVWSCKNEHDYSITDIWPLRETTYEGVPTLVPFAYDKVLTVEYGAKALTLTEFEGHRWMPKAEKWIYDPTVPTSAELLGTQNE